VTQNRRRPLVYAAHPLTTYGTALEAVAIRRIQDLIPVAELINPAIRYVDAEHWQDDWPRLLPTLAGLVVFGDEDGSIGAGCLKELADAWRWDLPVAMLNGNGQAHHLSALTIRPDGVRDPCRLTSLIAGAGVDLALLIDRPRYSMRREP
jgi:hypothetical protein